ncbi:hypothetical protein ACE5IS_07615 [Leptospira wolffii]|uniref:Secreted protein n=1 Tax=Leptospira wolffii TaxID=409998 RepID=A0ABV5BMH3_9LEPT
MLQYRFVQARVHRLFLGLFVFSFCYKGPQNGSFLEFLWFESSYIAYTPPVFTEVFGLAAATYSSGNSHLLPKRMELEVQFI